MTAQIVSKLSRFLRTGLKEGTGKELATVPTESQFYRNYVQHVDVRGRDGSATAHREAILRDGFKKGLGPNALPPHSAGPASDVMSARFRPRVGDVVYLVPKGAYVNTPNGAQIKEGWKPAANEIITITEKNKDKSAYELFTEAARGSSSSAAAKIEAARKAGYSEEEIKAYLDKQEF
jgi:hypothetical protein